MTHLSRTPQLAVIFLALLGFAGCSGGGRVEVKGGSNSVASAALQPVSTELGAEEAVHLLKSATSSDETNKALDKIERENGLALKWNIFWDGLAASPTTEKALNEQSFKRLALLDQALCREDAFKSFARFVLRAKRGFEYLAGKERKCRAALGPELTALLMTELQKNLEAATTAQQRSAAARLAASALAEEHTLDAGEELAESANKLSVDQWRTVAELLRQNKEGKLLVELMTAHVAIGQVQLFSKIMGRELMESPASLNKAIADLGFEPVLELLRSVPLETYQAMSPEQVVDLLRTLAKAYSPKNSKGRNFERCASSFRQYSLLRIIERNLDRLYPMADAIAFLEQVQESFEKGLPSENELAAHAVRDFVQDLPPTSPDALWFKLRVLGREKTRREGVVLELSPSVYRLDQLLAARLNAQFAVNPDERSMRLETFCRLLNDNGVAPRTLSLAKLKELLETKAGLEAGCFMIAGLRSPLAIESSASLKMAYDSVISAPGRSLDIRAHSFDGAFVNLSADRQSPALAAQPMSAADLAHQGLAITLVLGVHVSPGRQEEAGMHFFVLNYPYYRAQKGPAADGPAPLAGFSAGSLSLAVEDGRASFAPVLSALGGPGQKGVPPRAGGTGDFTRIATSKLVSWIDDLNLTPPVALSGTPISFLEAPTVGEIKRLLSNADRNANDLAIAQLEPTSINLLEVKQQEKIHRLCPGDLPAVRSCLQDKVGPEAMKWLSTELEHYKTAAEQQLVLEYFKPTFTLKPGEAGDLNPDGPPGANGKLELQGFFSQEQGL